MWKVIPSNTRYEASDDGYIRNAKTKYVLKMRIDRDGYLRVTLCQGRGNNKSVRPVHRLIAEAFIENEKDYPQINHKDENKLNNHVSNLEWCDAAYNNSYGTRLVRFVKSKTGQKYKRKAG